MFSRNTYKIKARTNIIQISDLRKALESLVNDDTALMVRKMSLVRNDKGKADYEATHRNVKVAIKQNEDVSDVPYSWYVEGETSSIVYFYMQPSIDKAIDERVDLSTFNENKLPYIFQSIITLRIKERMIDNLNEYFDIPPALNYQNFYLGASFIEKKGNGSKGKKECKILAYEPDLLVSKSGVLSIGTRRKCFEVSGDESVICDENTSLIFAFNKKAYGVTSELNSTKNFSEGSYMSFGKGYDTCENHVENILHKLTKEILEDSNILFKEEIYEPEYFCSDFSEISLDNNGDVVIIDNYEYNEEEALVKDEFYEYLNYYFKYSKIVSSDSVDMLSLSDKNKYIVLNRSSKLNGSSISYTDKNGVIKYLNTTQQAISKIKSGNVNLESFDFYSRLKIINLDKNLGLSTHGLNLKKVKKEFADDKKKREKKIREDPSYRIYAYININKVKKINNELNLKYHVNKRLPIGTELPKSINKRLSLMQFTNIEKRAAWKVCEVEICNGLIRIIKQNTYPSSGKQARSSRIFYNKCPSQLVKNIIDNEKSQRIHSNSIYIFDHESGHTLYKYSSSFVPKIIGHTNIDTYKDLYLPNSKLHRKGAVDDCVLPYYITKSIGGSKIRTYISDRHVDDYGAIDYFVSTFNPVNEKIEKRSLIYRMKIFDNNMRFINPLESELAYLYFGAFTYDFLNNSETSKSSILDKVIREQG